MVGTEPKVARIAAGAALLLGALCAPATPAAPAVIANLTNLPAYPHLSAAAMDGVLRTEDLGRWCATFTGVTDDPLGTVEEWYRGKLARASETDLGQDARFKAYPALAGIKLALGVDYVALYRIANRPTVIELHRCHW